MKKLYLFGLMLTFALGSLILTSCDDKDEPTPATGGEIVGTWEASIDAGKSGKLGDDYTHKLTWEFKKDKSFVITTNSFLFTNDPWGMDDMLLPDDPTPPSGLKCNDIRRLRLAGTYNTDNGKLTLNVQKYWEYDYGRNGSEQERWRTGDNSDGSANFKEDYPHAENPLVIDYSIDDQMLILGNGDATFFDLYVITCTLTRK